MISKVREYLQHLQAHLCTALEKEEIVSARFIQNHWENKNIGYGYSCILNGDVFEQAGVNFSHVTGNALPKAATEKRSEFVGAAFEALGVSAVIHPKNPFVPTAHLNVRYFQAKKNNGEIIWWFGGGFDLTPYYGFDEDCMHFHNIAKKACDLIDPSFYPRFKKNADDYFFLQHRQEQRGIGGIFFDDLNELSFEKCFLFLQNVGNYFVDAYIPIVQKRKSHEYEKKHSDFQAYRRGRYVEFNLIYDRGTLFGLQFGGRVESILTSLPPTVEWRYNWKPEANSPEAKLTEYYLKPRKWI